MLTGRVTRVSVVPRASLEVEGSVVAAGGFNGLECVASSLVLLVVVLHQHVSLRARGAAGFLRLDRLE